MEWRGMIPFVIFSETNNYFYLSCDLFAFLEHDPDRDFNFFKISLRIKKVKIDPCIAD